MLDPLDILVPILGVRIGVAIGMVVVGVILGAVACVGFWSFFVFLHQRNVVPLTITLIVTFCVAAAASAILVPLNPDKTESLWSAGGMLVALVVGIPILLKMDASE